MFDRFDTSVYRRLQSWPRRVYASLRANLVRKLPVEHDVLRSLDVEHLYDRVGDYRPYWCDKACCILFNTKHV
jgi:hypothetical protein